MYILGVADTRVFGPGGLVLWSDVNCTGTEQTLGSCSSISSHDDSCGNAGVICIQNFGKCPR